MHYWIDGHNLIAQLPDIDLEDPNDEAKLIYKLRSFAARTGHRMTVVFDGGLPGGVSDTLSTSQVIAKFASSKRATADQILIGMIRRAKKPQEYTLVSSDQELIDVAEVCEVPVMRIPVFIEEMCYIAGDDDEKDDDPHISPAEVEEWLAIFSKNNKKR